MGPAPCGVPVQRAPAPRGVPPGAMPHSQGSMVPAPCAPVQRALPHAACSPVACHTHPQAQQAEVHVHARVAPSFLQAGRHNTSLGDATTEQCLCPALHALRHFSQVSLRLDRP